MKAAEATQVEADEAYRAIVMSMPNLASPEAPAGGEDDYVVLEHVGTPRDFAAEGFEPRDHVELGRMLGAIDIDRGVKVSGARFYYLTGVGADLEIALVNLAIDQARAPASPPSSRRRWSGRGPWTAPASSARPPTTSTSIEGEDLYLVGTSEVPLAAYHSDEILDGSSLPRRYAAFSPCYRKEAGSYGKDTAGIIRVHWFDKVEMFTYTTVEESYAEHQRLLGWEKEFLSKLGLAFRVIDVAAGDLGLSARAEVRLRGLDPDAGPLPRAHLDVELHRLPGPPPRHPRALRRGRRPPADQAARHAQRHAVRDDADHRGDPRDPPAGGRLGARPGGAAPLPPGP